MKLVWKYATYRTSINIIIHSSIHNIKLWIVSEKELKLSRKMWIKVN